MIDDAPNASWRTALAFYDSLAGPNWAHIPGFRKLLWTVSRSPSAAGLTAVTSHETLIVSPYSRYPDWFEGRHLRLHPLTDGSVRIDNCPERFDRRPAETWTVSLEAAADQTLRLIAEL